MEPWYAGFVYLTDVVAAECQTQQRVVVLEQPLQSHGPVREANFAIPLTIYQLTWGARHCRM